MAILIKILVLGIMPYLTARLITGWLTLTKVATVSYTHLFRQGLPQAMYLPLTESAFSFTLRRKKDKKNYLPFLLRSTLLCPPTMRRKRLLFRNLTKAIYTSRFPRYKLNPVVSYSFPVRKSLWTDYIKNDFKFVRTVPVRKPL